MSVLAIKYAYKENSFFTNVSLPNQVFVVIAITSFVLFAGLRYVVGTDYWTYVDIHHLNS